MREGEENRGENGIYRYKMGREKLVLSPFHNTFESPKKVYEILEYFHIRHIFTEA